MKPGGDVASRKRVEAGTGQGRCAEGLHGKEDGLRSRPLSDEKQCSFIFLALSLLHPFNLSLVHLFLVFSFLRLSLSTYLCLPDPPNSGVEAA